MSNYQIRHRAFRIAGIYLVLSLLWIFFSDKALLSMASAMPDTIAQLQTYKGFVFVFLTAIIIFVLTRNSLNDFYKTRDQLNYSQQRYRDLLSNVPIGIYHTDANGQLVYVNSFIIELLDMSRDELLKNGWFSRIDEADRERVITKLSDTIKQGKLFCEEYRVQKKDHSIRWVIDIGHPEINKDGDCIGYRGTLTDITVKMESNEKIRKKDELMDRLMEFNPNSIALISPDGQILREYCRKFPQALGVNWEEICGMNIKDFVFDEDIPQINNILNEVLSFPGKSISQITRIKGKSGETYWLDYTFTNMLDDPAIGAIVGNGRNITELKQAEFELSQSELLFRTLVEASLTGVYLIQNGQFIYVNPQLQKILGYSEDELYQMASMLKVVHEDDQELVKKNLQRRFSGEIASLQYPFRCRHKQGHVIHVEAHGSRIIWKGQAAVIGTLQDITERVEAEKNLVLFRTLIDRSSDAIEILDPVSGRFLDINERGCLDLGYTREEFLKLNVFDIDTGVDPVQYSKNVEESRRKGMLSWESEHQRKDGSRFPVEVNMKFSQLDKDYLIAVVRDISTRKQAEEKEDELQEKLNLAITAANIGFWDWEIKTNKVFFSREWKSQLGYAEDEIDDEYFEWESRLHPDDLENALQRLRESIENPETEYLNEFRLRHKDGTYRWIMALGDLKLDATGKPDHFFGSHIDITHLKEAEAAVRENEARLSHVLSANPTVLYSMRFENNQFIPDWTSESITRIFGYTIEEALQPDFWETHLHPDDKERCIKALELTLSKDNYIHDYRFLDKKGYPIYVHDELRVLRDSEGNIEEIIGSWSDVTELHEQHEKAHLYATAFENTSEGVLITGLDGEILSVNQAFMDICGYSEEELIGKNPRMLHSGKHDRLFYQTMWGHILKSGRWSGEVWNRRKNGEIYPQWLNINVVYDEDHQPSHYVGISTDITQRKYTEDKLEHLAHYDVLTDLPNSMLLKSRLKHAIQQAARNGRLLGVLNIDLDDFKKINDSLGHPAGDELLLAVSTRWRDRLRDEDTLARQGGDEFVILLEDIKKGGEIGTVAEDLLSCLVKPFKLSTGEEIYVEASIGISIYPNDGISGEELLRDADTALFRAKELGRNQYCYYTSSLGTMVTERLQLETALRQGLEKNELLLHYQPKVDIRTGEICGAEALIRWNRSGHGLVPPNKFIPLAERTGLIIPIGEWIIKAVCQQLDSWIKDGNKPIRIAINIAARQFREKKLCEFIVKTLNTYKLKPEYLEIEITESALMEKPDEVISTLSKFKELGIKISLDDFGTGYSNIAYLSRYPIDDLKIDASFIRNLETDPNALKLIKSVIKLAQTLGLNTIAEGVETREQLDYLKKYKCDEIQGYFFSKPVPAKDFIRQVQERRSLTMMDEPIKFGIKQ